MEAQKRFSGSDAERMELQDQLDKANRSLFQQHSAEARRYEDGRSVVRAIEYYRLALEFAPTSADRDDIIGQIGQLEHRVADAVDAEAGVVRASIAPQGADVDEDFEVPEEDEDEAFVALLGALPDDQADLYESLGASFKSGYVALMQGRLDAAAQHLEPLLEADGDNAYLQYEVGRLRLLQRRFEDAESLLSEACRRGPDVVSLRHARIEALWGLEDWATAERAVEEAFEIDDELLENFVYAAETCLRSGEADNGVEIVQEGIGLHERSIVLHRLLGKLQAAADNPGGAVDALEQALRLRWHYNEETEKLYFDLESAYLLANLYLKMDRNRSEVARAEELFRALLNTEDVPSRWAYLVGLARAQEKQGQTREAMSVLVDAAALVPDDSEARTQIQAMIDRLAG